MSGIFCTGAAGFFMSHLIPQLLAKGHEVWGCDIVHQSDAWRIHPVLDNKKFHYVWGSAGDADVEGIDYIIHAAAVTDVRYSSQNHSDTIRRNTLDCLSLLDNARRENVAHTIVFSTHSVYGSQDLIPTPEHVGLKPSNFYGAAKAAQEIMALSYARELNMPVTVVRPSLMFGERERTGALVSTFLKRALTGQQVTLDGGGMQTRDMNYVENVAGAIIKLLGQVWAYGRVFNIGGEDEISILHLAKMAAEYAGRDIGEFAVSGPPRAGEEGRLVLDGRLLRSYGLPPHIGFNEGFRRTAEWVKTTL